MFKSYTACIFLLFVFICIIQLITLPRFVNQESCMIHFFVFVFVFVLNTWFRGVPSIATFGNTDKIRSSLFQFMMFLFSILYLFMR